MNVICELSSELQAGLIALSSSIITLIVTLVVTRLLRFAGITSISVDSFEPEYSVSNGQGGESATDKLHDSENAYFLFDLSFWNPSDENIGLRTPKIRIISKRAKNSFNADIYAIEENTNRSLPYSSSYSKLSIVNIPSREVRHFKVKVIIKKSDYSFLDGKTTFAFIAKRNKQKNFNFRRKLLTQDFSDSEEISNKN